MNLIVRIIIDVLLVLGVFFAAVGVLGVIRLPDVFCRLQSSTCTATLGTLCMVLACVIYAIATGEVPGTYIKLLLVLVMVMGTNPISNHALCKGAYKMGAKPAKPLKVDDYAADFGGEQKEADPE